MISLLAVAGTRLQQAFDPRHDPGTKGHPFAAALVLALIGGSAAQACGLEPMINGGFTVSHPASIPVAVAVAAARRDGLLPQASPDATPNDVLLRRMLADLRRLQARLNSGRKALGKDPRSFSVVLVGPGLWSHFHASRGSVLARYHTTGPLPEKVAVVTHHAVLQAILDSSMTLQQAAELGLLAFADGESTSIQRLFESGFPSKT